MIDKARTYQSGFITMELLMAMALIVLSIATVILLVFGSQDTNVGSQTGQEALYKSQQQLEAARAAGFDSVSSTSPTPDDIYTKSLTVSDVDAYTKQLTSLVSWDGKDVTLSTRLTKYSSFFGEDTCNPTSTGNWTQPQDWKGGYGYADISSNTGATGLDVFNHRLYLVSDPSSSGTDDFYVIDVSNPKPAGLNLPIIGHFSSTYGLTDVKVVGKYAYATADSIKYQLLVIDISDPTNLSFSSIVKSIKISGADIGKTLFYADGKLYVGLNNSSTPEFYIYDVSGSNAGSPQLLGSYEIGTSVDQILVKDNLAYVAGAQDNQIQVLDVSDPAIITLKQELNPSGSTVLTGQSLALSGNTLYFGRIGGGVNPAHDPHIYSLNSTDLSQTPNWSALTGKYGPNRMVIRGNLLFMSTSDPNAGFQIWDTSNPSSPNTNYGMINIQQTSTAGMDCEGNLIYVGQRSNRALQIIGPKT